MTGKLSSENDVDVEIKLLIEAVYLKYNCDFRNYSGASLKRRILYALDKLGCSSVSMLQDRIFRDPRSFSSLLQHLTIPTSEMFRDPGYFLSLRERICPVLQTYPSLKIWIAGCSTGEEIYSTAIVLEEEGLLDRTIIYATDINPQSLQKAEAGIFKNDVLKKYSENYVKGGGKFFLSRYYTEAYDAFAMDKRLIRSVVFADHSLATDHVFSEAHFISCRNVLIYFERSLQERSMSLFYESLVHRGFLGLGPKESIQFSSHAENFEYIDRIEKLFQKK